MVSLSTPDRMATKCAGYPDGALAELFLRAMRVAVATLAGGLALSSLGEAFGCSRNRQRRTASILKPGWPGHRQAQVRGGRHGPPGSTFIQVLQAYRRRSAVPA